MDGREGMSMPGSASYYLNRGIGGPGGSGPGPNVHGASSGPTVFKNHSNPNLQHPNIGVSGVSTFHVENPPSYPQNMNMAIVPRSSPVDELVKKKRGRPRKYGPDGANMSLGLSPMSAFRPSSGDVTSGEKSRRGRPPGTGWRQKLAPLGEWMNSSAGLAFTPHVLHIGVGEDIAAKIFSFAQQRPRALCILSACGSVSSVTLRQPTNSAGTLTYEGRFEILCLSGSYLVSENGGCDRTGGISISVCSPDGQIVGGAVGGRLIASNPVQVVACSFVYGGSTKAKSQPEPGIKDGKLLLEQSAEKTSAPVNAATTIRSITPPPNSGISVWQSGSRPDVNDSEIDLTRG